MTDSQAAEIPQETALPKALIWLARRPFALLSLLGLLLWLPGILCLPATDRDESRFAQSSRQMIETGNLVDIRFGHVPRYKKPVGIYWLQAAATAAAGWGHDDQIWTYRLPSLLGAVAASWLTVWCAVAFAGPEAALVAGLLMLGSVLLTAEATIATTDAVLLACVLGVQGVLFRVWRAARDAGPIPSNRTVMLGWTAVAAGILVKFPVVPGVAIATVIGLVAWDRQWRQGQWRWLAMLKPLRGLLLTLVLISPWLVAIAIQSHGAFFQQSLGDDFATKIAGGQESHGALPGYYLLLSAVSFWPAILFIAPGIVLGILHRGEPATRFLLAWGLGWWLVVEAVPTKLPHYVLPSYPALSILAAVALLTPPCASLWLTVARWVASAQFVIGAALLAAALILAPRFFGDGGGWPLLAMAGVGAVPALAALVLSALRKPLLAMLLGLVSLFAFVPGLTVLAAPHLTQLWVSERLKQAVTTAAHVGDPPPVLAGYEEPSLVFALGGDTVLADGAGAANAGAKSGGLALVEDDEKGAFLARLAELQDDAAAVGEVSGFNYSRGRSVHITIYRVSQLAAQ